MEFKEMSQNCTELCCQVNCSEISSRDIYRTKEQQIYQQIQGPKHHKHYKEPVSVLPALCVFDPNPDCTESRLSQDSRCT